MKTHILPTEVFSFRPTTFLKNKNKLIESIKTSEGQEIIDKHQSILTDYRYPGSKKYFNLFCRIISDSLDSFSNHLKEVSDVEYKVKIDSLWFQIYKQGGFHRWHFHIGGNSDYSSVLFVSLPEGTSPTLFKTGNVKNKLDLEEGDFIIFPNTMLHKSDIIKSKDKEKIVISCNLKCLEN